jgi:hypothetical protein
MKFPIPKNTLPRLERLVQSAVAIDGSPPFEIWISVRHKGGKDITAAEAKELRAILAGYGADGPLDDRVETGGKLPK